MPLLALAHTPALLEELLVESAVPPGRERARAERVVVVPDVYLEVLPRRAALRALVAQRALAELRPL